MASKNTKRAPKEIGEKAYLKHDLFNGADYDFLRLDVSLLDRGYFQTRIDFDTDGDLQELADSIKSTNGNFTPIVARKKYSRRFEIISGERRVRATMIAGLDHVLALVRDFSDEQAAIICLTENLQRKDLNPIEEAEGIQQMLDQPGMTQKDVAKLLGKSRPYISNSIRLLSLDSQVKDLLKRKRLDVGHGKALASLKNKAQQREWGIKAARNEWSVRELEGRVRKILNPTEIEESDHNPNMDIMRLEMKLSDTLCFPCRINIDSKSGGGALTIRFAGASDFDGILERVAPSLSEEYLDNLSSESEDS